MNSDSHNQLINKLEVLGYKVQDSNQIQDKITVVKAYKNVGVILPDKRVECELIFEFKLNQKNVKIEDGLKVKLTQVNPKFDNIETIDIRDLKSSIVKEFNKGNYINSHQSYSQNNSIIRSSIVEQYFDKGELSFGDVESLLLVKFMKEVDSRLKQIETLLQTGISKNDKDESVLETDRLLVVDDVVKILGLAKATIYSKTSRNELPYMKRGKKLYFRESEIMKYLKDGKVLSNDEVQENARKMIGRLRN